MKEKEQRKTPVEQKQIENEPTEKSTLWQPMLNAKMMSSIFTFNR